MGSDGVHGVLGLKNPCKNSLVVNVRDAARRILSKRIVRKEPITPYHLQLLVKEFGGHCASNPNMRILTISLLGFAGFFRYSVRRNIKRCDIVFHKNYVQIFLEKSETDIYREGSWVLIAKTFTDTCPVNMLIQYLAKFKLLSSSEQYISSGFMFSKKQNK